MPTDDVGNHIIFDGLSGQPRGDFNGCLGPQTRKRKDLNVQIPNPPAIGASVYITKADYQDPYDSGIPQDDKYLRGERARTAKKGENASEGIGIKAHFSSNNKGSGRDGRRDESGVSGGREGRSARSGAGASEAEGWGTSVVTRHAGTVRDMAVSPDGKLVASASGDHLIHISHLPVPASATTARISCESPHGGAGSSTNNGSAAGAAGEGAAVSGAGVLVLRGHKHIVSGVSFSPDGGFLVSSSFDKTLRLWVCCLGEADSEAGQEGGAPSSGGNSDGGGPWRLLAVMEGHRESVSCVSWRPSGKEKKGEKVAKLLQQIETHYTQNVYRDRKERLLSRKGAHGERDGGGGARQGGEGRAFAERERERDRESDNVRVQDLCVVSGSADHAVVIWQVSLTTA
jgi:WD40 repeat protein